MLKIIKAKYLFLCDANFTILKDKAIVFDEKIIQINDFEILNKKYPTAKLIQTPKNTLILPAFINTHTHLEFSANSYTLEFGDFLTWLKSVINARSALNEAAKQDLILKTLSKMARTGTGTVGEISSFGSDLKACARSNLRIIFFNEILGANEEFNETKKNEFLQRFKASLEYKNELFIPAISLHSPYSLNFNLAQFALNLAKKHKMLVSAHFLESIYEKKWLQNAQGGFKKWLKNFSKNPKPNYTPQSFTSLFKDQKTLFTHCVFLDDFTLLNKKLHSITHCAVSNRLLCNKTLNLKKALKSGLNIHLGTDGLSSNNSLSMLDEMRANLFIHSSFKPQNLAKELILMTTLKPAQALGLDLGELKVGKIADLSVFEVSECKLEQLPLQFILHAKEVSNLFIGGKECRF